MQISMMKEKELEKTFADISAAFASAKMSIRKMKMIPRRRMKIPPMASMIHEIYDESVSLSLSFFLVWKIFVRATRPHPSISVVMNVDIEWTRYSTVMNS